MREMNQDLDLWQNGSYRQDVSSGYANNPTDTPAWRLWESMTQIYGQRWIAKNGNRPTALWEQQIGTMTADQLSRVCQVCVEKCRAGSTWPPDFAEFISVSADAGCGALGITTANILVEYKRWRNASWKYSDAEAFPWRHAVLYHICVELKRVCMERNLTAPEMEKHAALLLQRWEKKVASGFSVPPVRRQIAAPKKPAGPTPAQLLREEYERRKAAGLIRG